MQVVLLERIAKLGQIGDIVTVKDGYARNYLLPAGKVLRANKENLERFKNERTRLEARNLTMKSEAKDMSKRIGKQGHIIMIRQSSESGQLYGSVNKRDIATALTEIGFSISRNQVERTDPIKTLGMYQVMIKLHPEVMATIEINVARTEDEAKTQAGEKYMIQDNNQAINENPINHTERLDDPTHAHSESEESEENMRTGESK